MELIGKLDSPYVRRVAIALHLTERPFIHRNLSVFRDFAAFQAVNPVVKAPTLVTDSGVVLMESSVVIDHLERSGPASRSLWPHDAASLTKAHAITGLALAACEKTVQIVYEHQLRPPEKRHPPWLERVTGQLVASYALLEEAVQPERPWLFGAEMTHADIIAGVAWRFTRDILPGTVPPEAHPKLVAFSAAAEAEPAFLACPP